MTASASDFVFDPVFGVVPKDVETANRLRKEANIAGEIDPTLHVPAEIKRALTEQQDNPVAVAPVAAPAPVASPKNTPTALPPS